ncbi:unnamed protein product [Lactuca virosa]|uniref:DYW domain-containing protein n=1 Tax=Lactuca virosa TaxID=75947 RepID=A0AAU9NE17_9ASTR|nr:unnamed protein product [Lactuca virosa]
MEEWEKEMMLCGHSEKLALAFGMISSSWDSMPLRIIKNLRFQIVIQLLNLSISSINNRLFSGTKKNILKNLKKKTSFERKMSEHMSHEDLHP